MFLNRLVSAGLLPASFALAGPSAPAGDPAPAIEVAKDQPCRLFHLGGASQRILGGRMAEVMIKELKAAPIP